MDGLASSLRGPGPSQFNNLNRPLSSALFPNAALTQPHQPIEGHNNPVIPNGQPELPVGDTTAAAFLAAQAKAKSKPNPLPISSLRTGFCYDIRMRFHQTVDYRDTHPEDPRRIYRIYKEFALAGLIEDRESQSVNPDELMMRLRARYATEEEILLVHSKEHLAEMQATEKMSENELLSLGRDEQRSLYFNNESYQCALLSCGGAIETCAAVMDRVVKNAFAVIRPPGHHAEPCQAMGFCLFNNVAIATKIMQQRYGDDCKRVLIVDWDVHHGNGTQAAFKSDPNVLYISLHRFGIYPEDKAAKSRRYCGEGEGLGKNVNIPWAVGNVSDADYIYAFQKVVMPIAYEFNPQLVIGMLCVELTDEVSAGFDAAAGDPIGGCEVTPEGYAHMTHMLMPLAEGKLVLVLEGGYNLESTSKSALACVKVLMGEPPGPLDPWRPYASEPTVRVVNKVINVQSKYWKCCRPEVFTIDGASPAPERLNEIIRAYQTKKAQEEWGMTPLRIAKNNMNSFIDQVFCTKEIYDKKTLVLFIHDPPEVVLSSNAVLSSKMDLGEAFLLDSSNRYYEWAARMGFGLIDVNIPPSANEHEEDEGNVTQSSLIQNAKTLCLYIWDNYVELTDAANVILIGAGEGCYGIEHLIRNRDVSGTVKGVVNFFGDFEPKGIGDTDEDKIYWYMKSSRVYIGPNNPILRRKKIPKRFGQCFRSQSGEINKLLNIHFEGVMTWITPRIPVDEDRMDIS